MSDHLPSLPAGGPAKPAQISPSTPEITFRDRLFLLFTLCFCVLLADAFFWHGPTASLGIAVAAWDVLLGCYVGRQVLLSKRSLALLLYNLFLAASLALGSNWYFRLWNLLALLVLLPVHAIGLSGAATLPWFRPGVCRRFCSAEPVPSSCCVSWYRSWPLGMPCLLLSRQICVLLSAPISLWPSPNWYAAWP